MLFNESSSSMGQSSSSSSTSVGTSKSELDINISEDIDPKKYYCTKPYDRGEENIRYRVRSCEQGKKPHRYFKNKSFPSISNCICFS